MKTFFQLFFMFLFAAILQQALPKVALLGGMKLPLFTSILIYTNFRLSDRAAWITSLVSAFFYDSLEPGPYGPALLAYPLITLLILRFRRNLFHEELVTQLFCGGVCGLLITICLILIYLLTDARPLNLIFNRIIGNIILGAIALPICSKVLSNIIPSQERGGQA